MFDEGTPLFVQIATQLADGIADGSLAEGERAPSSNELAAFHRINPATAAKGLAMLLDDGLLEKRRGVGMFVVDGARYQLLATRRKAFADQYLEPMLIEARRLGIDEDALAAMVRETRASSIDTQKPVAHQTRPKDSGLHAIGGPTR